jgi:hypothetical protein
MRFPDRALKESLSAFAITAKQANLAGEKYAWSIVSQLSRELRKCLRILGRLLL